MTSNRPRKGCSEGRPVGRPSLYRREFCGFVVEFCRQGYSLTSFAAEVGVCRDTISEWARAHPEFSVATSRAKAAYARWIEEQGRKVAERGGGPGTAGYLQFLLRNAAPHDFRDRREPEINLALPVVDSARTATDAIAEVLRAYGAGEIDATKANTVAGLARAYLGTAEIAEFEDRLAALERRAAK